MGFAEVQVTTMASKNHWCPPGWECKSCIDGRKRQEKIEHEKEGARFREINRKNKIKRQFEIEAAIKAQQNGPKTASGKGTVAEHDDGRKNRKTAGTVRALEQSQGRTGDKGSTAAGAPEKVAWWTEDGRKRLADSREDKAKKARKNKTWVRDWVPKPKPKPFD